MSLGRKCGGLVLFLFLIFASPVAALDWTGAKEELVPTTWAARTSEAVTDLLYRTPVDQWKPRSFRTEGCLVTLTQVRPGKAEEKLWELRIEPGKPWGEGTWMVFVDGLGRFREVRIILLAEVKAGDHGLAQAGTWIRFSQTDSPQRSRMDLFLAARLVSSGTEKPLPVWDLPKLSEEEIFDAQTEVPLASLVPFHRWEDQRALEFYAQVRKRLSVIPLVNDALWIPGEGSGQESESGRWARLPGKTERPERGLGPWGVTLWTADAVLQGWGAPPVNLKDLLVPRINLPGYSQALAPEPWEDPGFNLSWVRNLGLAVTKAAYPKRPLNDRSSDVQNLPFFESLPDAGYEIEDLDPVVHLLAVKRPGRVFLATLSIQKSNERGVASAVNYLSPVVVLPWVGEDGKVRVAVFNGSQEISLKQWVSGAGERRGVRPDHFQLVELPLPESPVFPNLPLR